MRNPANDPEVGDRWAYDADDGPVDIEVLAATPSNVGFRYATSYYTWARRSFADVCKNWRIVHRAPETDLGGP